MFLQNSHVSEKERQELGENHLHMWQLLKLLHGMIPYRQNGEEGKQRARKPVFRRETFECWWKRGKDGRWNGARGIQKRLGHKNSVSVGPAYWWETETNRNG